MAYVSNARIAPMMRSVGETLNRFTFPMIENQDHADEQSEFNRNTAQDPTAATNTPPKPARLHARC